jgi:DNA repair exonuclease SbcCD ATPase subunit
MEEEIASSRDDLSTRRDTWEMATNILEALREAELDVVDLQLQAINPLIQRIYSRIDPNPVFRNVSLVSKFVNRQGHLNALIEDTATKASSEHPDQILSSSQLNAFALSLFVAFNLGLPVLPLSAILLDDPLQSLDAVNLLGVADLLRRIKPIRQIIVSTHDPRAAELLARKLRPTADTQSVTTIEFTGWGRRGPEVEINAIEPEQRRLRIAV